DVNYDFKRIWFSPEADRVRTSIRNKECHCPLANASYTNMLMHIPTLSRVISKAALSPASFTRNGVRFGRPTSAAVNGDINNKQTSSGLPWLREHTSKPKGPDYAQPVLTRYRLGMRARGAIQ